MDSVQFSASITFCNRGAHVIDKDGILVGVVSWVDMVHDALNFAVPSPSIEVNFDSYIK